MTTVVIIGVILGVALIGGAVFLLRRAEEDA
jgi:hypothetical protein